MKAFVILSTAVAGVMILVASDDASPLPNPALGKGGRPAVVHRSPAIGGAVRPPVAPVVVRRPAAPPVARTPAIVTHPAAPVHVASPPVVHQTVNNFVEVNKNKFVGTVGRSPAPVAIARPRIEIGKGAPPVVAAYQKRIGAGPIRVGGRVVDVKPRNELVINYQRNFQQRIDRRFDRAELIRRDLGDRYNHLFAPHWWDNFHDVRVGWWGRWPGFAAAWYDAFTLRNHWGWWRPVTWGAFAGWCYPNAWGAPLYYDYGGNVVFDNSVVYFEGTPIASEEDYAAQATALAATGATSLANAPPSPDQIEQNWLPLGVFAVTNETAGDPTIFMQMAVNKNGVIAGTYTNSVTNEALPITGAVDPNTQRAAWYVGDKTSTVFDTGAYNLSQPDTQVLVHFGPLSQQTWLMTRLPEPAQ